MLNRFFSNLNRKLAEQLVSKAKPVIDKIATNGKLIDRASIEKTIVEKLEPYEIEEIVMGVGAFTGATIGAASAYDKNASTTKNIAKCTVSGVVGGAIGYVAPPIIVVPAIAIGENVKPLLVVSSGIGLGFGTMKMFSKSTPKSPSENLKTINANNTSNNKSFKWT